MAVIVHLRIKYINADTIDNLITKEQSLSINNIKWNKDLYKRFCSNNTKIWSLFVLKYLIVVYLRSMRFKLYSCVLYDILKCGPYWPSLFTDIYNNHKKIFVITSVYSSLYNYVCRFTMKILQDSWTKFFFTIRIHWTLDSHLFRHSRK